jgi:hypothetical protein
VMALTARQAMQRSEKGGSGFVQFNEDWFDYHNDATPDASDVKEESQRLRSMA